MAQKIRFATRLGQVSHCPSGEACHPERSEGSALPPKSRSLATLSMTNPPMPTNLRVLSAALLAVIAANAGSQTPPAGPPTTPPAGEGNAPPPAGGRRGPRPYAQVI